MDISFATDSRLFSTAVEQLRKEGVPLLDGNIKERYELLRDGATEEVLDIGKYKIIGEAPYSDEEGNHVGFLEVGSVQELPTVIGDDLVTKGVAELIEKPAPKTKKTTPKKTTPKKK